MSNPGGCPPHIWTETRMPGGTGKDGQPLPPIVIKTCNRCGATQ